MKDSWMWHWGMPCHGFGLYLSVVKLMGWAEASWWVIWLPAGAFWGVVGGLFVAIAVHCAWEQWRVEGKQKDREEKFPCGHPRVVCGVSAPRCPICDNLNFKRGNPAVAGQKKGDQGV